MVLRMRYGGMGPWAGWASPWGGLPGDGVSQEEAHMDPALGHPIQRARA